MYLQILPFQFSLDGGLTTITGTAILSPGLTTIEGMLFDPHDNVIVEFNLTITDDLLGFTVEGGASVEIEDLGEAEIGFQFTDNVLGTAIIRLEIDGDIEPEDLIMWTCIEPEDSDLRDQLLQYLPMLQTVWMFGLNARFTAEGFETDLDHDLDEGDEDQRREDDRFSWIDGLRPGDDPMDPEFLRFLDQMDDGLDEDDLDAFGDFETDPDDTVEVPVEYPLPTTFELEGVTYVLEGLHWVRLDDLVFGIPPEPVQPQVDPLRRDYLGTPSGALTVDEIVAEALSRPGPISDLPVEVIVAQVLAGNVDGRRSAQL